MLTAILLLLPLLGAPPDDLTHTITALDAEVFDAYNKCDVAKFASFFAEDLEFYHDQSGLSVGRQATVDALKNNICGKVHRSLVPGTLAVYPLKGYGAVETGIHLFCSLEVAKRTGKCGDGSGVARFTHLWRNLAHRTGERPRLGPGNAAPPSVVRDLQNDGVWKITRVISYDHCNSCSTGTPPDYRVTAVK